MTAAGDGALVAGRVGFGLAVVGRVDAEGSAETSGVVVGGGFGVARTMDSPTHGGRKSKA